MLEFIVPGSVGGTATVTVRGSLAVPDGLAGTAVGDTFSGALVHFDVLVAAPGGDYASPAFWSSAALLSAAVDASTDVYEGSTDISTGLASALRSLYVRYHNIQAETTGGFSTTVYNVTLTGDAPRLTTTKHTRRGRFV